MIKAKKLFFDHYRGVTVLKVIYMTMGINDNISALYQLQSTHRHLAESNKNSCAPVKNCNSTEEMSKKQKIGVGVCVALGVASSLMLLAKLDKSRAYSINPLKMFTGKLKDSYLINADYKTKEIVTMGAGSILGGLIGGRIFGDKKDSNSRLREGIVQIANISVPIATVEVLSTLGNKFSQRTMSNWCKSKSLLKQAVTKFPATVGAMSGLMCGMFVGNKLSNAFNEKVFHKKDDRPIKWKDFSAHVDDIGVAATFVAPDNLITKVISRLIPAALLVAGYETGVKKETVE